MWEWCKKDPGESYTQIEGIRRECFNYGNVIAKVLVTIGHAGAFSVQFYKKGLFGKLKRCYMTTGEPYDALEIAEEIIKKSSGCASLEEWAEQVVSRGKRYHLVKKEVG